VPNHALALARFALVDRDAITAEAGAEVWFNIICPGTVLVSSFAVAVQSMAVQGGQAAVAWTPAHAQQPWQVGLSAMAPSPRSRSVTWRTAIRSSLC
jgi:hypothetical protein